jgi:nucleolar pre-ribosomal-associated protein 1
VINRYIQNLLQHPRFTEYGGSGIKHSRQLRELIGDFLYSLFQSHPSNTCQPSHVEPLLTLYQGTLSRADRTLLSIFQLFESQRAASVGSLFARWTGSPGYNNSANPLDALRSLDSVAIFRTCLSFPRTRRLDGFSRSSRSLEDEHIYDPVFVILLFSRAIRLSPPATALVWVEVFRTNVVSLLICALSGKHSELRELALTQLSCLRSTLEVGVLHLLTYYRC